MRKANGPNVIQRPMSEHELYRWRKVTKVVYQHGRFKRNAKKVNIYSYVCLYVHKIVFFSSPIHFTQLCIL